MNEWFENSSRKEYLESFFFRENLSERGKNVSCETDERNFEYETPLHTEFFPWNNTFKKGFDRYLISLFGGNRVIWTSIWERAGINFKSKVLILLGP